MNATFFRRDLFAVTVFISEWRNARILRSKIVNDATELQSLVIWPFEAYRGLKHFERHVPSK